MMPVCVLFVSSRSGIVFNPNAGAITDQSQSAKDIDQYFKSPLCGGPRRLTVDTHLPNGWSTLGERAHDRN